jgi:aspartate aminotransferase
MASVLKFAQARLCPPTLEQIGSAAAYNLPADYFNAILAEYQDRRNILVDILTSHPGVELQKPEGAFYLMVGLPVEDSDDFAKWMLKDFQVNNETVMVAPGFSCRQQIRHFTDADPVSVMELLERLL